MFKRVLIANRGEIAVRIARTLREMGIRSVLLASYPDRRSLAARSCDEVVVLDGSSAAETYLDIGQVIEAARRAGCEAIHPGYGFLAENAAFAEACTAAGITFIGPPPEVLRLLGDKATARQLAVREGVEVVPGYDGVDTDEALVRAAAAIGYPVMIKARGGGGGRGMRRVHATEELAEAIASARREAQAAFGDAGLLLERLVEGAHHVEVQVLADSHGNVVHLGERECSVQRRHQKLIEEAPSPNVDRALRERLTGAALRIARAAGVVNAATVEFLLIPARDWHEPEFFFMEVNPRLQVEHPVTEEITGIDIVEQQVRIAAGEALPFGQEEVRFAGHAIECRINAEDPAQGFRPSVGVITRWDMPADRADRGYVAGDTVPALYDSLAAKAIELANSRAEALADIAVILDLSITNGVTTNRALLRRIVADGDFQAGTWTVNSLDDKLDALLASPGDDGAGAVAAAVLSVSAHDPWRQPLISSPLGIRLLGARGPIEATVERPGAGDSRAVRIDGVWQFAVTPDAPGQGPMSRRWIATATGTASRGRRLAALASSHGDPHVSVMEDGGDLSTFWLVAPPPSGLRPAEVGGSAAARIVAPLSGTIAQVSAEVGQAVEVGDLLVVLEAMKMEHRIEAMVAGVVMQVNVAAGEVVREGDVLVEVRSVKG